MDSAENVKSKVIMAIIYKTMKNGMTNNTRGFNHVDLLRNNISNTIEALNEIIELFNKTAADKIDRLDSTTIIKIINSRKQIVLNATILRDIPEITNVITALCQPNAGFEHQIDALLNQASAPGDSVKPVVITVDAEPAHITVDYAEPVDPSVVVGQLVDDDPSFVGQTGDHAQPVIEETMERDAERVETPQQRRERIQRIPRCISNWCAKLTRVTGCASLLSGVANCTLATNAGSTGMIIADPTFTTFVASAAGSALCYIAYNCLNMQYNMEGTGIIQANEETCLTGGSKTKKRRNKSRKTLRRKKQKRTRRAKMNKRNNIKK